MGGAVTTDKGALEYTRRNIYLNNVETYGWLAPTRPITLHQKALFCLWMIIITSWLTHLTLKLIRKWKTKRKMKETDCEPDITSGDVDLLLLLDLFLLGQTSTATISRFGRGDASTESDTTQCLIDSEHTRPWKHGETFLEWLNETAPDQPSLEEFLAKATLFGCLMLYFWLCDFQHVWPKTDKQYSRDMYTFLFALLVLVALVFTVRKTPQKLLNRDQTEEWKGWMQVQFVWYHYFDAQEVFNSIRCYIASYVWMTGFGNFSYFWTRKDYSIFRLIKMLFRLNFLVVMVMAVTNNEFVRYYICAMHTYWFLSVYAMMAVFKSYNTNRAVMAGKFAAYLVINVLIFDIPGASYKVFWPFQFILNVNGKLDYWVYRSTLDHWTTWVGMLCAYNYPYVEKFLAYLDKKHDTCKDRRIATFLKAASILICTALFILWMYYVLLEDRAIYKKIHPYTSWIPILIYIWLRNIFPYLRSTYLNLFAWLGKVTLETYLSQIHIYMIGNAQKTLIYLPRYPMLNFMLSSVLYVAISYVLFHHTLFFNAYIFPKNMRVVCKNVIILSLMLVFCYLFSFVLTLSGVW
ncbi:hypothetical protein QZH41_008462 [Actinostola sp. cb2023]|nr:hypothetical protein QZH41_008462 [Actinostola sp. cb2023]